MTQSISPPLNLNEIRADQYKELQVSAYQNDVARLQRRLGEFVHAACPACGMDRPDFRFEKYKCRFVECPACATLYMCPRPSPEVMDDYYAHSENYAVWNKYIFPRSEASRREKICRPNLDTLIRACEGHGFSHPSLLEIGPGFGTFAALAKESGAFSGVTVVERTPEMAAACRSKGLTVIDTALESIPDSSVEKVDVAVCFEVIEHVFDAARFLSDIHRLLKDRGLFMFTCPNGEGFDTLMLQATSPAVDTEHVNLFNTRSVHALLERSGFSVLSVETPGRLDVELVRRAVLNGEFSVDGNLFWKRLLIDDHERLGGPFQAFLVANGMSGNMRVIAQKTR
jgi:SAM-dependent methyltransferase